MFAACSESESGSSSAGGSTSTGGAGGSVSGGSGGSTSSGGSGGSTSSGGSGGSTSSGGSAGSTSSGGASGASGTGGGASAGGLRVENNRLLGPDGKPFHGRGANLHDTRSCNACTSLPPDVQGLNRWSDELLDVWGANFVRFDLESYASSDGYRVQWQPLTADAAYLADIKTAVTHMTDKPGVYVMVTVFTDPTIKENNSDYDSEWPTAATIPTYEKLAETFYDNPKVLFALTNEPHGPADRNPDLAQRYLDSIDAIRAVEQAHNAPEHVIVVQAPEAWARYLDYFVQNPLPRSNVAYEVHVYNPEADFDRMLTQPSATLPIIVGEYGPSQYMNDSDIQSMWTLCKSLEIPHIAWNFHQRCPPDLLQDVGGPDYDGCGLSAATGFNFAREAWGDLLFGYLAAAW